MLESSGPKLQQIGPYRIVSRLGSGGMGEVYRASDTRLGREVAIKVLLATVASDPERIGRFRREARVAASLNHPNIAAIYGFEDFGESHFLVMELVEGRSLADRLKAGPLPIDEALGIVEQIAGGLEAAHDAGIVHRDLKPDNLFLTTAGVVKVLDFGLARVQPAAERNTTASDVTGPGTVMGTVSYMAPEQAKGHSGDARSDIFALGTVLYEMLSGRHPFRRESSAETLTAILRDEPPELGTLAGAIPTAVERLVRRCLAKKPEDRFQTANDLGLALEAVDRSQDREGRRAAAESVEERPYPGLSSFTEGDAARFFGREAESSALWEKLRRQKLLALIGPSGVGKSSFLRAGVLPQRPLGWGAVYLAPGAGPVGALARALTAPLTSDPGAMADLVQGATEPAQEAGDERLLSAVSRWRQKTSEALLVVDQFEELFTLSPKETQDRFATLLGRVAGEADVHVLLSMRDDFLFRCTEQPALSAVFDSLTPLTPPSSDALRRALVEPAARLGVRFEDEALVAEMVAAVEKERGALPLLAFAVSRLWDERDRERQVMTRSAYERIGGVAGALAQHAEATLQAVGPPQEAVVREIFRNLVTAEGTRAAREREELLSVFGENRVQANAILDVLVSARLLTEYEAGDPAVPGTGRIEIVHESLLTQWPRLERWLAQDAEGALLRDQLRQAARLWGEKSQPEELLWTGRSYREYALWRERYAGGLSTLEEDFSRAMSELAGRRRRRRRLAAATALATALAVATGAVVLWARAEKARRAATEEARQREAAQLLALGQAQLAEEPAEALAYAIASLDRADNVPARRFAVEALWHGAAQLRLVQEDSWDIVFSPDGQWAAVSGTLGVFLWSREGGPSRRIAAPQGGRMAASFGADGRTLATWAWGHTAVSVWSLPAATLQRTVQLPEGAGVGAGTGVGIGGAGDAILAATPLARAPAVQSPRAVLRRFPLDGSPPAVLGRVEGNRAQWAIDLPRDRVLELREGALTERPLGALDTPGRLVRRFADFADVQLHSPYASSWDTWLCTIIRSGQRRLWLFNGRSPAAPRVLHGAQSSGVSGHGPDMGIAVDPSGRFVSSAGDNGRLLWDLAGPPDAQPTLLRSMSRDPDFGAASPFSPDGAWFPVGRPIGVDLWPVRSKRPYVLFPVLGLYVTGAFSPDGQSLATVSSDLNSAGEVRLWPLSPDAGEASRLLYRDPGLMGGNIVFDPGGRFLVTPRRFKGDVLVLPLDGTPPRILPGYGVMSVVVLDRDGRRVAGVLNDNTKQVVRIRIWDLEKGGFKDLDPRIKAEECLDGNFNWEHSIVVSFLSDGRLLTDGASGLRLWDIEQGTSRRLRAYGKEDCFARNRVLAPDGRRLFTAGHDPGSVAPPNGGLGVFSSDLDGGARREIGAYDVSFLALDPLGRNLVTTGFDGVIRVGPVTGEEPHLLYGHTKGVDHLAVSPDGRWILSTSRDGTIRLWPMPEGRPLHTLPYNELLAKLRTLTNLRAVADAKSATGYKVEVGPFPGWAHVPEW
jgi:WD40 repeat protein